MSCQISNINLIENWPTHPPFASVSIQIVFKQKFSGKESMTWLWLSFAVFWLSILKTQNACGLKMVCAPLFLLETSKSSNLHFSSLFRLFHILCVCFVHPRYLKHHNLFCVFHSKIYTLFGSKTVCPKNTG